MTASDDPRITPSNMQVRSGVAYLDDSIVALRQVRKALASRGVLLECYETPEALLERASEPALRVVLLDVDLGAPLDGPAVARALAQRPAPPAVAFFTAEDAAGRASALRAIGPVFDKNGPLSSVLDWLVEQDRARPASA